MNDSLPTLPRKENRIENRSIDAFAQGMGHAPAVTSENPAASNQEYRLSRAFGIIGLTAVGIISAGLFLNYALGDNARQKALQETKIVRLVNSKPDSTIQSSEYFNYINAFSSRTGISANVIAAKLQRANS